ncbi:MAG TPA: SRPBCC domain-containing protein [Nitrospiraceae bacterium]|nr:SRPBCC domain-containing protein [Nitrospiraceae bacterium]
MNQQIKTTEINLTRMIEAGPDEVFEAWLDHTSPGSPWFGVSKAIVNPPEIDSLFYSMYRLEGREIAHYGRFITLERPRKIQHTWVSEATHGMESIVTLSFELKDGKTQVSVNHTNVPDDEGGRRHKQAWGYVLARMSSHFGKGNNK